MPYSGRAFPERAGRFLVAALVLFCAFCAVSRLGAEPLPGKPSLPPSFSIPVEPLGFSAPGPYYLGQRYSMVSLDFLGEDRLLFTFHVPGLLHRDAAGAEQQQVRALVLALPSGAVLAEALWTVHDRSRYLCVLKDGHFLLSDRDSLVEGDVTLQSKPLFQFPGPLLWMESDPSGQYLVTNSREPEAPPGKSASPQDASQFSADLSGGGQPDLVVRILRRDSGGVLLVSRSRSLVHLPINTEGYLETLKGPGLSWLLILNYFSGGNRIVGQVDSNCEPTLNFLSESEIFASGCDDASHGLLEALTTSGNRLWFIHSPYEEVWPLLVTSSGGLRLARETLATPQLVNSYSPIDPDAIKGQVVRVFDAANGKIDLIAPAVPALDAGGNVAISPSGRRVAVLDKGFIQVFDLPAPPPLPAAALSKPASPSKSSSPSRP